MTELQIDGYEIVRELGGGGMAKVYLARELSLDRTVAIKVLPPDWVDREDLRKRFHREAQTIARLDHRAIVPVYDYGEGNKGPYLAMRHMHGGSLADKLKLGPLSLAIATEILDRLADGLDKAHEVGVVHRDIKPANILFDDDGRAYLADFGIVKLANPDTSITPVDSFIGTPAYMSPEQVSGDEEVDGRSDIYALGVVLFQMLTGALPYQASAPIKIAVKHIADPLPDILEFDSSLPKFCDRIIKKAMAKKPQDRYQTARKFADDLLQSIDELSADSAWDALPTELTEQGPAPVDPVGLRGPKGFWSKILSGWGVKIVGALAVLLIGGYAIQQFGGTGTVDPAALPIVVDDPTIPPEAEAETPDTAVPTNTPEATETAVEAASPTDTPTLTPKPSPTDTPLPSPTETEIVEITNTPEPITQLRTTETDVNIYAGPSSENAVLGLLRFDEIVTVEGKVRGSSWYSVKSDAGISGWVDADLVEFAVGSDDDVPVTWPPETTGTPSEVTPSPLCPSASLVRKSNNDIHIIWNDYPDDTHHLSLSVSSAADDSPLVYPNYIDQTDPDWAENGFLIGSWLYEQRGFPENTTYVYVLQAIDEADQEICATSGTFTE